MREIEAPTEKAAISGACLRWYERPRRVRRSRAFRDKAANQQVGPKINTAYPQAEKFLLANAGRLV